MRFSCLLVVALGTACSGPPARAAEPTHPDVQYAQTGGRSLRVDIYRPDGEDAQPLVVWVHGGAWRSGSKDQVPVLGLVERGFAIASVDYRLSPVASFPAQVHDIKSAIRFLRHQAGDYRLDPQRFAIAGASAGGHLAALVGVSSDVAALEGEVGTAPGESSAVGAIVSFYGASNLQTILGQSTPHGLSVRVPALRLLLGGTPDQQPDLAQLASPIAHVDADDPPLLLIHGDQDPQMPINQAIELDGRYRAVGAVARLKVVHGGVHGGAGFYDDAMLDTVASFLREHLPPSP